MRYAIVENGVVQNVVLADAEFAASMGWIASETAAIGDLFDGADFTAPAPPAPSTEKLREEFKERRAAAVAAIVVEVDGLLFDGDEASQGRMARAVIALQAADVATTTWTLADNQVADVTLEQLLGALVAAGTEQSRLWIES